MTASPHSTFVHIILLLLFSIPVHFKTSLSFICPLRFPFSYATCCTILENLWEWEINLREDFFTFFNPIQTDIVFPSGLEEVSISQCHGCACLRFLVMTLAPHSKTSGLITDLKIDTIFSLFAILWNSSEFNARLFHQSGGPGSLPMLSNKFTHSFFDNSRTGP